MTTQREIGEASSRAAMEFIDQYITENGWAPSIREIAEGTGRSVTGAHTAVGRLVRQGLIEVGPHPRQIRMKAAVETL